MKKFTILAISLVLLGAGCAQGGSGVEIPDISSGATLQVPAPGNEGVVEMIVNDESKEEEPEAEEDETLVVDEEAVVEDVSVEDAAADETSQGEVTAELPVKKVTMESGNFFFSPASIAVEAGQMVEITFSKNSGTHTLVIDEIGFKQTVKEGETISFKAPAQGGTYSFYCDIGKHRALGMEGTLHVKEL